MILLTAFATVETAVEAMKIGAYHFANKPFNLDDVVATVGRALETTRLRREVRQLRLKEARPFSLNNIVGGSDQVAALRNLVAKIATSPASTVLLTGESGNLGKDLVAKVLHYSSDRANRPFMNITCSALPETLLESELFGHERGAFTGALAQKRGMLEPADGGTVFLDEIGEMVPALQAKLLRFLERTFKRVGASTDVRVDVRIIAATNRNLEDEVAKGRFRHDLFYRMNVLPIALPPLRSHVEDIPVLAAFFVDGFNREFRKSVLGATPASVRLLQLYGWPGNVRELRNVIERAMLLCETDRLDLPTSRRSARRPSRATGSSCPPTASTSNRWSVSSLCRP